MEAPGAFDRDRDCDLHLEASDGLLDDTWKLGSTGSSSKCKREVDVQSSSDGRIASNGRSTIEARSPRDRDQLRQRNQHRCDQNQNACSWNRSSSDGGINGREKVHDQGPIATRS